MKKIIPILAACLLPFCAADAQNYTIDWFKISGGGGPGAGTNGNSVYSLNGTIGQQDASGALTGGGDSLTGGFWARIYVVQTPGFPNLAITFIAPNSARVSWPDTGNHVLQQNADLATGTWMTSGFTITTADGTNSITITPAAGNLFFRLKN